MKLLGKSVFVTIFLLSSSYLFSQVPVYNSYPSAAAVLFLDFDGHTVDGTSWNWNGPIVCGPSNLNADQITEVFNRVAEDYRPFNINITTDSAKYWAAPIDKRMRVILTITSDWYGSVGGVSYVGSFNWGDNTPAFVFTQLLGYNTKNIAEAAAHEAGHTLGLNHQAAYDANCSKTSDYSYGNGSGEIGWAPIMGVGYYKNYTLWHNGSNPYGCSYVQNDLGIIEGSIKAPGVSGYRTDDYDSTFTNAAGLAFSKSQFTTNGIISTATDKDMFRFNISKTGRFQLNAVPFNVGADDAGSDLDVQVKLYNSSQKLIGTYNPPDILSTTIDTMLAPDTYYYSVSGASNKYASDYASLGSYSLQATFTQTDLSTATLPLRQLKLQGSVENNTHKFTWVIDADEKVIKQSLEVAADGRNFQPVGLLTNDERSFSYAPMATGTLQYRLNVLFDNNRQYYSNVLVLRNTAVEKPHLANNLLYNNTLTVNSPAPYNYLISDYTGKVIAKGMLGQGINTLHPEYLSSGMYLIQYTNGQEQYVEKFVRQ